jgi:hypothetical protein
MVHLTNICTFLLACWFFSSSHYLQLRVDLDVKYLASYVDKGTPAGFADAKNLYLKGAHFRPQAIVSIGGSGTTVAIASKEVLSGTNTTSAVVNVAASTSYAIGSKNLTLNYVKNNECILGGLASADQVTYGCKFLSPFFFILISFFFRGLKN